MEVELITLTIEPEQYFDAIDDVDTQDDDGDVVSANLVDDENWISLIAHKVTNSAPVIGEFVATEPLKPRDPKAYVIARLRVNTETIIVDEIGILEPKL